MGGSGVQRWVKFSKYLPENGWQPVIYTPSNPDFPLKDESLLSDIPEECEIIKQPIWEPYQIASLISNKKRKDLEVDNFRAGKNPSMKDKFMNYVRSNFFIPDPRVFWVKKSIKYLTEYLKENPVDVIVTNGTPHSMHLIGLGLKEKLGVKWVADFRDPWTKIDFYYTLNLTKKSDQKHRRLEKEVVSKADAVTVAWDAIKDDFLKYNKNIQVITNGYDVSNFSPAESPLDKKFTLAHIGLLNADRDPQKLWKVLKKIGEEQPQFLEDLEIKLIGNVEGKIIDSIKRFGLESQLNLVGYIPHSEVHDVQQASQILLLVVSDTPIAKGMVVGKLFEYMKARRPILAICPEDGSLAKIINETQTGKAFDYQEETRLEQYIVEAYAKYKNGNLSIDPQGIEKYSRRNLTKDLVQILEKLKNS